ncbi:myocardin-related transcription factor B isoform X4 [Gadus macrocephalus]|uniref:myocardin-related transcription factor B isoform X4 n=2 Tax=Gadus macrocephalus TaxID=80720 RepID=UPI0028CB2D5D|nr:myocardin-related transcription factor B isoform X4 [Gadus macrocephalus]
MGLQVWPPSKPPPSSMACLDVETPTVCRVLQLCLQQRRSREQLVEQGIMPPLKMPAAFHDQIRHLERARTGNFLKHKICNRPERSELVRMHILQETQAVPSLQATQLRLKRARLADDLNEKLAQRPGPMELVVKNILPVVDAVAKDDPPADQGNDPKIQDVYEFDENSTDSRPAAVSAEQTPKQAPQQATTTTSVPPREAARTESSPPPACQNHTLSMIMINKPACVSPPAESSVMCSVSVVCGSSQTGSPLTPKPSPESPGCHGCTTPEQQQPGKHLAVLPPLASAAPPVRGPILVKQSQPRPSAAEKNRGKKGHKDPKPRVKKLKYHQYVPPDQKQDAGHETPLDSAYVRLLQQQQQFLQLQILNQQQQQQQQQQQRSYVCQAGPQPATLSDGSARSTRTPPPSMSDHLPYNVDEMKVAELKAELKLRGLLVSGTKNDLVERLRMHHDRSKGSPSVAVALDRVSPGAATTAAANARVPKCENPPRSPPPVSPVAFKVSRMGLEESGGTDSETRPALPAGSPGKEAAGPFGGLCRGLEKDQRLHEKERQIEELMRQLEREQKLVEELKLQLEVEKRGGPQEESAVAPRRRHSPSRPVRVKQEFCGSPDRSTPERSPEQSPPRQFFLEHQRLPPTQTLQPGGTRLQHQAVSAATVKLPDNRLHTAVTGGAPDDSQTQELMPQKHEASGSLQQQCHSPSPRTQQSLLSTSPGLGSQPRATQSQAAEDTAQQLLNTAPNHLQPTMALMSKFKDPPRYEDAVKQTRCRQTAMQVPTTLSQHMDDLFDVLIESGEITPFIRHDPSCPDKLTPVTANVTTLPINTVLSRPPAQIQVAQPPDAAALNPSSSLMALVTMETMMEGTLHKQLLEHPLVSNMELDFSDDNNPLPLAGQMHNAHLDTMDWLDLTTLPSHGHEDAGTHLGMSPESGVFSSDFLESPEFQLNWE